MNTRTETIDGTTYCAYCGKELQHSHFHITPSPTLVCNCMFAKEEQDLCDRIKQLYSMPLAESLIELKVEKYRNELLGRTVDNGIQYVVGSLNTGYSASVTNKCETEVDEDISTCSTKAVIMEKED